MEDFPQLLPPHETACLTPHSRTLPSFMYLRLNHLRPHSAPAQALWSTAGHRASKLLPPLSRINFPLSTSCCHTLTCDGTFHL